MGNKDIKVNLALENLFYSFVDAGLQGRFEEAFSYLDEEYSGVGMGEQGLVHSKKEAVSILENSYTLEEGCKVEFSVKEFIVNFLSQDVAMIVGDVFISTTLTDGKRIHSGLMQTIGARFKDGKWMISFTHASPTMITLESVEAYPIRFMENTLSILKSDMKKSGTLYLDALTGVLNREGFELLVEEQMQDYNPKWNTSLFMIDLDDFKMINDRLGHQVGDVVLKQVAQVLKSAFRSSDAVGRIGGDEFMVLITGKYSVSFLEKKANEIMRKMYVELEDNKQIPISISIGIAYGKARNPFDKLYRIADIALYSAKKSGKNRYYIVNADVSSGKTYSSSGANLISLQTLLDYTEGKEESLGKTPYEALVENVPGGVVLLEIKNQDIYINHCNEWFSHFIGYSEEEVEEMERESPFIFVHPDDLPIVLESIQSIRKGIDSSNIVYRVCHKNGDYLYINQMTTVMERSNDNIVVYGIETNVNDVIRLKKEVEDSQRELELLLANTPGSVVMFEFVNDQVNAVYRNEWFSQLLGYTQQELDGLLKENPLAVCHPEDIEKVIEATLAVHQGQDHSSIVYRARHKDGSYTHLAQTVSVMSRDKDSIILYGIQTDVEETYRLKQEIESSQKALETFLDAIPGGVLNIIVTDTLKLIHRNDWTSRFLGYTKEELFAIESKDPLALVHPKDIPTIEKVLDKLRSGEENTNFIYRILGKNGMYYHVRITASLVERNKKELIYNGVITDVGEMIRIQKELQHTNHKLEVLLTTIPGGIAVFEITNTIKITQYGNWIYDFTGYESNEELEEARKGNDLSTVWPDDLDKIKMAIDNVRKNKTNQIFQSLRLKCKDGQPKKIYLHGSVIERKHNKVMMYVIYTNIEK